MDSYLEGCKKNIIIGDSSLDLTDKIIELLNKEIKSLKIG